MEQSFTSRAENRWNYLRGAPHYSHIVSVISRPNSSLLIIKIQTNEAKATITATEQLSTLELIGDLHHLRHRHGRVDHGLADHSPLLSHCDATGF